MFYEVYDLLNELLGSNCYKINFSQYCMLKLFNILGGFISISFLHCLGNNLSVLNIEKFKTEIAKALTNVQVIKALYD